MGSLGFSNSWLVVSEAGQRQGKASVEKQTYFYLYLWTDIYGYLSDANLKGPGPGCS